VTGRVSLPKCRHCRKAIVMCEARPPHAGCSSALGWLHTASHRHACETGDWRNCAEPNAPALIPQGITP
jgi:hypothetical protein